MHESRPESSRFKGLKHTLYITALYATGQAMKDSYNGTVCSVAQIDVDEITIFQLDSLAP